MAKKFRITVNGQAYEVEVEELGAHPGIPASVAAASVPRPEPRPVVNVGTTPAPRPVTAAPRPSAPASGPAGKGTVSAPIPGVINDIKVHAGQKVKARDLLMMLEAMKMQNEILSPVAGTVREVFVPNGATVNTGDRLVAIDPE